MSLSLKCDSCRGFVILASPRSWVQLFPQRMSLCLSWYVQCEVFSFAFPTIDVFGAYDVLQLLQEFMENGSLFDLINNETMYLTGEIILQVLRDVAQGLRYLHASKPPVLHGKLMKQSSMLSSDHLFAFLGLLTQSFHDGLLTTQVI